MKITVETLVESDLNTVWAAWNSPADIQQWNAASDDWRTTRSSVELRVGGMFSARMEAKDGSAGFDFTGIYTRIVPNQLIEYRMDDGREVRIEFSKDDNSVRVREIFDAEMQHDPEFQRRGWQAILDNFARHVQAKGGAGSTTRLKPGLGNSEHERS